jgi:hypothetical protein
MRCELPSRNGKSFVRAAEQAARCASGGRPACSQWHHLGIAVPHSGIFQVATVRVPLATIGLFVGGGRHLGKHLTARIVSCGNAFFSGPPMSKMIMYTCPKTGREVPSGVLTDENSLAHLPHEKIRVQCLVCGDLHQFWTSD